MKTEPKEFKIIKVECTSSLHDKFKKSCKEQKTNMSAVLIKLTKAYVREFEDKQPKGNIFQ